MLTFTIQNFSQPWQKLQQKLFTRNEQQAFLEDLSSLVNDGVTASQAIATISQISSGQQQQVAQAILIKISEGKQIADGLKNWFPDVIVEIVRAGEDGGTLAENLQTAARALAQRVETKTALLNALSYPITVLIVGLFVAVYIRHSVFINFADIKPIEQWPTNGRLLTELADFVQYGWWMLLIILGIIIFTIRKSLREYTGKGRKWLDSLPLFSLYRDMTAARLMEMLGLLLTNGIVLKRALAILQKTAHPYLSWHLYLMEFRLSSGRDNIADVLDTGLIKTADILRLRVIAKGKGFEYALTRLGRLAAKKNAKNIQFTAKVCGGMMLAAAAALAAFMIFAIYGVGAFVGA